MQMGETLLSLMDEAFHGFFWNRSSKRRLRRYRAVNILALENPVLEKGPGFYEQKIFLNLTLNDWFNYSAVITPSLNTVESKKIPLRKVEPLRSLSPVFPEPPMYTSEWSMKRSSSAYPVSLLKTLTYSSPKPAGSACMS